MRRTERGQVLVLFALTMILLVVMVTMTLAIGMKARERIELQTLADATAYSNAIATARTYNLMAAWNRAQISHMVVLAGAQSHISFASWAMAHLRTGAVGAAAQIAPCAAAAVFVPCFAKACVDLGRAAFKLEKEYRDVYKKFKTMDKVAAKEVKALQSLASLYGVAGKAVMAAKLIPFHASGGFDDDFLEKAVPDTNRRKEYSFSTVASTFVSAREVGPNAAKGAWDTNSDPYPALPAVHGTRKSDFTRVRNGIALRPNKVMLPLPGFLVAYSRGDGYFGPSRDKPHERKGTYAWADDQGASAGLVFGSGCPWPIISYATAYVKGTDDKNHSDKHRWSLMARHYRPERQVHDMGSCGKECPSVWVGRAEFNINPDSVNTHARDQWKQPKAMVAIQRDYTKRTIEDPWNLLFRLRLQPADDEEVDIGKKNETEGRFKKQGAYATSIAYYHRHMGTGQTSFYWREPPNFFNPFWRATLVAPDVDNSALLDMNAVLGAMDPSFAGAYTALTASGFKGVQ